MSGMFGGMGFGESVGTFGGCLAAVCSISTACV
jgi:hypothetical protein